MSSVRIPLSHAAYISKSHFKDSLFSNNEEHNDSGGDDDDDDDSEAIRDQKYSNHHMCGIII